MAKTIDVVRAWKDEEYRQHLAPADREALPENPAGSPLLAHEAGAAAGGNAPASTEYCSTLCCCGWFTAFTCYIVPPPLTPIGMICASLEFCGS